MPNILSAKQRVKLSNKCNLKNRIIKSQLKTTIKNFNTCNNNEKEILNTNFKAAIKMIDKAANKNVIHKNNAARKKQKLYLKFQNIITK